MSDTPPGPPADPYSIHRAVVQCLNALRDVALLVKPTAKNLKGDLGPTVARKRLEQLRAAVGMFPQRRLPLDPFVRPGGPFTFRPYTRLPLRHRPFLCTSCHDGVVQLARMVYDRLRQVKTEWMTDPKTGEQFEGCIYENATEVESEIEIDGKVEVVKARAMGQPATQHYTAVPWSSALWNRLHPIVCDETAELSFGDFFTDAETRLEAV